MNEENGPGMIQRLGIRMHHLDMSRVMWDAEGWKNMVVDVPVTGGGFRTVKYTTNPHPPEGWIALPQNGEPTMGDKIQAIQGINTAMHEAKLNEARDPKNRLSEWLTKQIVQDAHDGLPPELAHPHAEGEIGPSI